MEVEGLGEKLVDQLVDNHIIHTLPDLYRLGLTALASLERMADKSAQEAMLEQIEFGMDEPAYLQPEAQLSPPEVVDESLTMLPTTPEMLQAEESPAAFVDKNHRQDPNEPAAILTQV